ncbi:5'/3'-nucleotidase SurE [bacterium]|nr:5'/3'-nucleotidase SurE [bacterium]MBU1073167.1 5'/3'-nucleotidase SurE [bacterium]
MIRHILLSNDDGIDAHGLNLLARVLSERDDIRVTTVAPADQQSASSHSLTLRVPLRVIDYGDGRFAVTGTPTDSVLVGVEHILKDDPPDAVISGVNHGSNMGEDVTYSGTVAAALEGAILGLPSYAVSCTSWRPEHWDTVEAYLRGHLDALLDQELPRNTLLNVNIPDLPADEIRGVRVAPLGSRQYSDVITEQLDPRGKPYLWIGGNGPTWDEVPDTDATLSQAGYVVVTPLRVDLTHEIMLARLSGLNHEGPLKP